MFWSLFHCQKLNNSHLEWVIYGLWKSWRSVVFDSEHIKKDLYFVIPNCLIRFPYTYIIFTIFLYSFCTSPDIPYFKLPHVSLWYFSIYVASAGPFKRFSTCLLQNVCVNSIKCAMVCNIYFYFSKILHLH